MKRKFLKYLPVGPLIVVVFTAAGCDGGPNMTTGDPKLVFSDDFSNLANWAPEGPHAVSIASGQLYVKTVDDKRLNGQFIWCRQDVPESFRAEFDVTPLSDSGFFLVFFCQAGTDGGDILGRNLLEGYMPAGAWQPYSDWDKYTSPVDRAGHHGSRIRGYHVSYRRNESATCNLRKNPGLNLLKSSSVEAVLPKGQTARVALVKSGGLIRLEINGLAFMEYTDEKPYSGGRIGLRNVYDSECLYDNFRLYRLP